MRRLSCQWEYPGLIFTTMRELTIVCRVIPDTIKAPPLRGKISDAYVQLRLPSLEACFALTGNPCKGKPAYSSL